MSFPIHPPLISVKVFIRYKHYKVLEDKTVEIEDFFSTTVEMLRGYLIKNPGIAGSLGYGRNIRKDLKAKIILQWTDKIGSKSVEFESAREFIGFVKERPELARALEYS